MDTHIQTSTPQGSPILAYGEARGPRMGRRTRLVLIGLTMIVLIVGIPVVFLTSSLPFPERLSVLAAVRGGTALPEGFPRVWRETAAKSRLPLLLGLAWSNDRWEPFVVAFRFGARAGAHVVSKGVFIVQSDQPLTLASRARPFEIFRKMMPLTRYGVFVTFFAYLPSDESPIAISGPIEGNVWRTSVRLDPHETRELPAGDVAVDVSSLPEAWPFIRGALSDTGLQLNEDERPSVFSWTQATSALPLVVLRYDAPLSTSTLLSVAAATGKYDVARIQLPDGTLAEDLRLPIQLFASTSTNEWGVVTGTTIRMDRTSIAIQGEVPLPSPTGACDAGRTVMRLSRRAIAPILQRLSLPLEPRADVTIGEKDGNMRICW